MSKAMKLVLTAGLVGVLTMTIVLVMVLPGGATLPSGLTGTVLARGAIDHPGGVSFKQGTDVVVATNTFAPGGSSGWHSHPGGAIVVVSQGQITIHVSFGDHCTTTTYTAGQAFYERPSDVLNGVNEGTTDTVTYATFPSVSTGGPARIDQPDPGC